MDVRFINDYVLTFEMYKYWATHPVGDAAIKRRKKNNVACVILFFCGIVLIVSGMFYESDFFPMFGLFSLLMALNRLFVLPNRMLKNQYKAALTTQNRSEVRQKYVFSDVIIFEQGNVTAKYDYCDITKILEDENYFYLFYNPDVVLRIFKAGFVFGTVDEFRDFWNSYKMH